MKNRLYQLILKHYQPIFRAYDKDNSQTLQLDEMRIVLADNLGTYPQQITQKQIQWAFQVIDENNDGHITLRQYFNYFFCETLRFKKKQLKHESDLIDKEQFRKLMQNILKSLKIPATMDMVDESFDKISADKSGKISFEEYLKYMKKCEE